jgi:hypothetical protein
MRRRGGDSPAFVFSIGGRGTDSWWLVAKGCPNWSHLSLRVELEWGGDRRSRHLRVSHALSFILSHVEK